MCLYAGIYVGLYILRLRFKVLNFVTTDNIPAASSKILVGVYHITGRNVLTGQYSALYSSRKAANNVDWEVKGKSFYRIFVTDSRNVFIGKKFLTHL